MHQNIRCPRCQNSDKHYDIMWGKFTCSACNKRYSYVYNIYTQSFQSYKDVPHRQTTTLVRRFLYILEHGRCHYCRKPTVFEKTTIDHIIPLCKGGKNHLSNYVLSCHRCNNLLKKEMGYDEFIDCLQSQGKTKTVYPSLIKYTRYILTKTFISLYVFVCKLNF